MNDVGAFQRLSRKLADWALRPIRNGHGLALRNQAVQPRISCRLMQITQANVYRIESRQQVRRNLLAILSL